MLFADCISKICANPNFGNDGEKQCYFLFKQIIIHNETKNNEYPTIMFVAHVLLHDISSRYLANKYLIYLNRFNMRYITQKSVNF